MRLGPFKKRSPSPVQPVGVAFEAAVQALSADFLASSTFQHALTKGEDRETPVRDFFRQNLPRAYAVVKGEAIDLEERHTPQLDLMIYNQMKNFPFHGGDSELIPAEALLAAVEVKSSLDATEIERSLRAASQMKLLRPFREELAPAARAREPDDRRSRYLYAVFAYSTDLAEQEWDQAEYSRISRVAQKADLPIGLVDRIYVANRGVLMPAEKRGMSDEPQGPTPLLYFFMHIYNFLIREDTRRHAAPYLDYAGRMTRGWRQLE